MFIYFFRYRTRKNKLNQKDQSDPMILNNNKNIEIKNMKILEQNSIGEELFEFSEDSLNEKIKKKTKYQIFTPEKKLLEDKIEILDEDNFINIDEKKE